MNSDLYTIAEFDPDNGEVEPTELDYARFEMWVIERYGLDVLNTYCNTNWRPVSDV